MNGKVRSSGCDFKVVLVKSLLNETVPCVDVFRANRLRLRATQIVCDWMCLCPLAHVFSVKGSMQVSFGAGLISTVMNGKIPTIIVL